jgi:hypothetical protein
MGLNAAVEPRTLRRSMHASASERIATLDSNDAVILEWRYTPANFFEEPVVVPGPDCEIRIEDGKATATVAPEAYDEEHKKRDELHQTVEARFLARQVLTHRKYELPHSSVSRKDAAGRLVPITLAWIRIPSILGEVRILASTGEVDAARDYKRERLDRERAFGDAVARLMPNDPLLEKMLRSSKAAVEDPADELVHLYEIRDALSAYFDGERAAQDALGVSSATWKRLGLLANDAPVEQGRHRGKHHEPLRKATAAELTEARKIARELIEAYVRWRETPGAGQS